jgi:hypothetical protein
MSQVNLSVGSTSHGQASLQDPPSSSQPPTTSRRAFQRMCSSKNLAQPRKPTISELAAYYEKNPSWQNAPVDSPLRPFFRSRVTPPLQI